MSTRSGAKNWSTVYYSSGPRTGVHCSIARKPRTGVQFVLPRRARTELQFSNRSGSENWSTI